MNSTMVWLRNRVTLPKLKLPTIFKKKEKSNHRDFPIYFHFHEIRYVNYTLTQVFEKNGNDMTYRDHARYGRAALRH